MLFSTFPKYDRGTSFHRKLINSLQNVGSVAHTLTNADLSHRNRAQFNKGAILGQSLPSFLKSQQKHPPPSWAWASSESRTPSPEPKLGYSRAICGSGMAVSRWAAGSGIWNSQDTDVEATLGSQPGLPLSLIPIFGCLLLCLIHVPMSTLHNLPQTVTALELERARDS
jgi:hypothetical protein